MGLDRWVDSRVQQVKVADVERYLFARGWKRQSYPQPDLLVFEGPRDDYGKPIAQVLPAAENLVDYRQRLTELITALAVTEDRAAQAVLDDMLRKPAGAAAF